MRTPSGLLALVTLIAAGASSVAHASPRSEPTGSHAVVFVRGFWDLVSEVSGRGRPGQDNQEPRPRPQAIPAGGPTVDLNDLSEPTAVEKKLRTALNPSNGEVRVTVTGGSARLGDFSIGSTELVSGNLLVVRGNAESTAAWRATSSPWTATR